MIAFYKILSIPRKKQSASNELLLTEGPHGIEFSLNAVMPKAFFDHSRSEHTFQTNASYSISGFPHIPLTGSQWRKLVPERRVTLPAEKDVDPSKSTRECPDCLALTEVTWASQIVLSEKSRPGWEGDPSITKG